MNYLRSLDWSGGLEFYGPSHNIRASARGGHGDASTETRIPISSSILRAEIGRVKGLQYAESQSGYTWLASVSPLLDRAMPPPIKDRLLSDWEWMSDARGRQLQRRCIVAGLVTDTIFNALHNSDPKKYRSRDSVARSLRGLNRKKK